MVLLNTPICDFDEEMPKFNLKNIDNKVVYSKTILGKNGTLVFFICNHCPYVKAIIKELVITVSELKLIGINSVGIMPNDVENYPEDNFERMQEFALKNNFEFPYLIDESQNIAKKFKAVCTPDFFGYNATNKLQYRGRFAEMKNLEINPKTNDLFNAMHEISKTSKGPKTQIPSAGCSIKWRKSN